MIKLYRIKKSFARANTLPVIFVGEELDRSSVAAKIAGQCLPQVRGVHNKCFLCGNKLEGVGKHFGICEDCGEDLGGWTGLGGYTLKNLNQLKQLVEKFKFVRAIPFSAIKEVTKLNIKLPKLNVEYKKKKAALVNGFIICSFDFDKYLVDKMKELEGSTFQKRNKTWHMYLTTNNLNSLSIMGFELCPELKLILNQKKPLPLDKINYREDIQPKKIKGLLRQPYGFQSIGAQFIDLKEGNALVADDMGLGKTMQALSYLQMYKKEAPVVIICPATLKYNWVAEIEKTLKNRNIQVLSGRKGEILEGDIFIINYDIIANEHETIVDQITGKKKKVETPFSGWVDYLIRLKPQILITDECHYYKNRTAKRTDAIIKLAKAVPKVIQLSATPIENGPHEFFPALNICNPQIFSSYWAFVKRYCGARKGRFGWELGKPTNMEELHHKLDGVFMIRRLKQEVLTELPDKTFDFIGLEIDNRDEYEKAEADLLHYLSDFLDEQKEKVKKDIQKETNKALKAINMESIDFGDTLEKQFKQFKDNKLYKASIAQHFVQFETLKQIVAKGKLKATIQWVKDFLESGQKLIIFAEHTFIIDALLKEFKSCAVKIDGSIPTGPKRQAIVEAFQNDPKIKIIIGNKAMQEGVTLTAAWAVAHIEYPWTPTALAQRNDRAHRIGQENAVTCYYLMAIDTVDEKIAKGLDEKLKIISTIMDGKTPDYQPLISDLMKSYVKKVEKR